MAREKIPDGALIRLKSGTEGWIKGQVVEYFDVIPTVGGYMYGGGMTPGYKVHILEGKHKDQIIQVPENYVEPVGQAKFGRELLYPHVPKSRQPLFPHLPKGQQPAEKLPQTLLHTKEKLSGSTIRLWIFQFLNEHSDSAYSATDLQRAIYKADYPTPAVEEVEVALSRLYEERSIDMPIRGYYRARQTGSSLELLASTEGDPISKFCCRQPHCGECAPVELLKEGRFLDRMSWLRSHYQEKHPGMWGKMSPMTVEDFEPVSPQYRHLVSLVSEPLPKEAD